MAGKDFTPELGKVLNSKKVSDHHAIIPTMELAKTDLAALPKSERNILTLAGARLLTATAVPHTFEAVTAVLNVPDSPLPQGARPFFVRVGKRLTEITGQP